MEAEEARIRDEKEKSKKEKQFQAECKSLWELTSLFTTNRRRQNKTKSAPRNIPIPSTVGSQISSILFSRLSLSNNPSSPDGAYIPGHTTPTRTLRLLPTSLHQTPIAQRRFGRKTVRFASVTPIPMRLPLQDNTGSSSIISPTPSPISTLPNLRISSKGRKIRAPKRWEPCK